MASEERKGWFSSPVQPAGLLVSAWFLIRLLAWLHLSLVGQVTPGIPARQFPGDHQEADEAVPYAYQPSNHQGMPLMGSRLGIDYGGAEFTVVYSPLFPSFHTTSLKKLESARGLFGESAYVVRLVLYVLGIFGGLVIYLLPKWLSKGGVGFSLMPGLTRDDPMNPR